MSTPVYNQYPTTQNRPMGRTDAQGRVIPSTFDDLAYQADLGMGTTAVYEGWARPGAFTDQPIWKICMHTYSGTTLLTTVWPEDDHGHASADYGFVWDDRADYIYA